MVNEDIPQNREVGVEGRDFAKLGLERCAESLECGWGVQLFDFEFDLLRDEFAL
jgi:hypothetical protein